MVVNSFIYLEKLALINFSKDTPIPKFGFTLKIGQPSQGLKVPNVVECAHSCIEMISCQYWSYEGKLLTN